jgi:hypothetical protein
MQLDRSVSPARKRWLPEIAKDYLASALETVRPTCCRWSCRATR